MSYDKYEVDPSTHTARAVALTAKIEGPPEFVDAAVRLLRNLTTNFNKD